MEWEKGTTADTICMVTKDNTALAARSGTLPVLGTPFLIALMENAAANLASRFLGVGKTTVGTHVDVKHTAPTPLGMRVTSTATLLKKEGDRLFFEVHAVDEAGEIGKGTHERFIVDADAFLERAKKR